MTPPTPCPYLDGRLERKVITHLNQNNQDPVEVHELLSANGFRRSHNFLYKPICDDCNACVPVRVDARTFTLNRSFARVIRINSDLEVTIKAPIATAENFDLFHYYQTLRHQDGDMAIMSFDEYRMMIEESPVETVLVEYRDTKRDLLGISLTDRMNDGLSMVYSFFNPEQKHRSLGTAMILQHIVQAGIDRISYVYLGYWIAQSPKMDYKKKFQPLEALGPKGWQVLRKGLP